MSYPQRIYVLPARRQAQFAPPPQKRARVPTEAIVAELLGDELGPTGPRKRERLTHLTAEEKLERRKMKNRVAAQNARDKKKERSTKIEDVMRELVEENRRLRMENEKLRRANEMLQEQQQHPQYMEMPQHPQYPQEEVKYEDPDIYSNVVYEEEVVGELADRAFESAAFISAPQQRDKARSTAHRRTDSRKMMSLCLTILSILCSPNTSSTSLKISKAPTPPDCSTLLTTSQRAIRRLLHLQKHVRHFRRVP